MRKIILFFLMGCMLFTANQVYSQVGINTETPNNLTELEITNLTNGQGELVPKGIMIPRMTQDERDQILKTQADTLNARSLLIYNTTEDCYNYFSITDREWQSLCGRMGKATFTFDCSEIEVKGVYIEGKELTPSNYISIPVDVTKAGSYTIIGETSNGYGFFVSGTFLAEGEQTVFVAGQGTPKLVQKDRVTIVYNGLIQECESDPVEVDVLTAAGTYSIECGTAVQEGVYQVGVALNPLNNYITLPVDVTVVGSYEISTNTVDGISFSGSGTFTSTGPTTVTLYGRGTPTSTETKTLTITANSAGQVNTTCNVDIRVVIPKKKILTCGLDSTYGYDIGDPQGHVYKMLVSQANFGTSNQSTVASQGFEFRRLGNSPSATQITNAINDFKPDIIAIGYSWSMSSNEARVFVDYLKKRGVMLVFSEESGGMGNFMQAVFEDPTITTTNLTPSGRVYRLSNMSHEILNGPFGDFRGLQWGDDGNNTRALIGLPLSEIETISNGVNISASTPSGTNGHVTAFVHRTLNLVYFGDGGFTAGQNTSYGDTDTYNTSQVFTINNATEAKPIPNTNYGASSSNRFTVYNSMLFGNIMNWAIKKAEFDGYNNK